MNNPVNIQTGQDDDFAERINTPSLCKQASKKAMKDF
jgi:hypothetical protein